MTLTMLMISHLVVTSPAIAVGVSGHVEQETATGRVPVSRFDQILEGATVITHSASSAQLRLASGSLLRVGANSELSLAQLEHDTPAGKRRESLRLTAGRIWAQVTSLFGDSSTFVIETPTAVAGIRGTSLIVEVGEEKGRFVLLGGAIDVLREGAKVRLDQPGSFVEAGREGFGKPGSLEADALRDLQRDIGGATGAMVAALVKRGRAAGGGQGGREASRGDIQGPGQLVDSPTAASLPVTVAPVETPAGSSVTVVVKLPQSGDTSGQ